MLLSQLAESLPEKRHIGSGDPEICSITYDSRSAATGGLFVCIRGGKFDGHEFIGDALKNGTCAVVIDNADGLGKYDTSVPFILVPDTRQALPILANRFYDYPSRKMKLIGVTGTKGKTTTTYLIEAALRHCDLETGVIGTLGSKIRGVPSPLDRTTPESVDLQALLARMVSEDVSAAVMEVSSHALALGRTAGCEYDVGVFTNLTHDHLDFHKTMEDYLDTKITLFEEYPRQSSKPFIGVVNIDDPGGDKIRRATYGEVITYGVQKAADVQATNVSVSAGGVSFDVACQAGGFRVSLKLGGLFNVYNSLAAVGAGLALGLDMGSIKAGLESVRAVDGRFEYMDCGQEFAVIVDYAHSPDSLESVLKSARALTTGKLIVLFGCGGDRDRAKRPIMGRIGSELADVCIVTSDNPRSEDPEAIIQEILVGIKGGGADIETVTDRRDGIRRALEIAAPGDLVLIAGKGHETYQIFKDRTIHFDDRETVRELLSASVNK